MFRVFYDLGQFWGKKGLRDLIFPYPSKTDRQSKKLPRRVVLIIFFLLRSRISLPHHNCAIARWTSNVTTHNMSPFLCAYALHERTVTFIFLSKLSFVSLLFNPFQSCAYDEVQYYRIVFKYMLDFICLINIQLVDPSKRSSQ